MSKELKWRCPIEVPPPVDKELLVESPNGYYSVTHYRKSYSIFACQGKSEIMNGWKYFVIEELNQNK